METRAPPHPSPRRHTAATPLSSVPSDHRTMASPASVHPSRRHLVPVASPVSDRTELLLETQRMKKCRRRLKKYEQLRNGQFPDARFRVAQLCSAFHMNGRCSCPGDDLLCTTERELQKGNGSPTRYWTKMCTVCLATHPITECVHALRNPLSLPWKPRIERRDERFMARVERVLEAVSMSSPLAQNRHQPIPSPPQHRRTEGEFDGRPREHGRPARGGKQWRGHEQRRHGK